MALAKRGLLKPCVLGFGLLEDGDVGVGVFPEKAPNVQVVLSNFGLWIPEGEQRQNRYDCAIRQGSCHQATNEKLRCGLY